MKTKPVIVSGIQPSGLMHIGNYLGAIRNWVQLQNSGKYDCYFFVADLHSLSEDFDPKEKSEQIAITVAELLAAGIDPKKSTLFVQSHIPEHTELMWYFNCLTPIAELERMTQYKDKASRQKKNINMGLFSYPVLQTADVLMYNAKFVPVGEDQVQHVELMRKTARWFNTRFGKTFFEPKPLLTTVPRIKSLADPSKKMSKSLGEKHFIAMADEPEIIMKKLKKAVTDTAGLQNLKDLLAEFADKKTVRKFAKKNISNADLKLELSAAITEHFAQFRRIRTTLLDNRAEIAKMLSYGTKNAQSVAEETLLDVRTKIGVR